LPNIAAADALAPQQARLLHSTPDALAAAADADAAAPGLAATLSLASSAGADAEVIAAAVESRLLRRLASFAAPPLPRAGAAEPQHGASPAVLRATAAGGGAEWEATVAALEARADAVLHAPLPSQAMREPQQPRRPWVTP
jgi:hypothetical protein